MAKKKLGSLMGCLKRAVSFRKKRPNQAEPQGDKITPQPEEDYQDKVSHCENLNLPSHLAADHNQENLDNNAILSPSSLPRTPTPKSTISEPTTCDPPSNDPQTPTDTDATSCAWSIEDEQLALDICCEKFMTNPFLRDPDPNQDKYRDWLRGPDGALPRGYRKSKRKRKCIPSEHPEYQDRDSGCSDPNGFEPLEHVGIALETKSFVRFEKMNPYRYFGLIEDRPGTDGNEGCCASGFCPQCVLGKDVSV